MKINLTIDRDEYCDLSYSLICASDLIEHRMNRSAGLPHSYQFYCDFLSRLCALDEKLRLAFERAASDDSQ